MRTTVRAFLCLILLAVPASAQTFVADSCFSLALGRWVRVTIFVPTSSAAHERRPALILLHGFSGNETNWARESHLATYVGSAPLLILMPDGANSWYVNALSQPTQRYEDLLSEDLVRFAAAKYGVDTNRLAIGGLSMGGYGALNAGLRHPDRFRFVIALSASLDVPMLIPDIERNGRATLKPSILAAFGADSSAFWLAHDPFRLVRATPATNAPYIYLANGIQDEFGKRLALYRAFADTLRNAGWRYEYHETPGRHDWGFWDREIRQALSRLREVLMF